MRVTPIGVVRRRRVKVLPIKQSNAFSVLLLYIYSCQQYETHLDLHVKNPKL